MSFFACKNCGEVFETTLEEYRKHDEACPRCSFLPKVAVTDEGNTVICYNGDIVAKCPNCNERCIHFYKDKHFCPKCGSEIRWIF